MIDLHFHSTCSDGVHTVEELHAIALRNGLHTIALTDHDTVDGIDAMRSLCQKSGIRCISGIELSTRWKKHDIHIIGLNIATRHPEISATIERQKACRLKRAQAIAQKLETMGLQEAWSKVQLLAKDGHITRPHFAQVLMDAKWVKDMPAAFSQFLARGKVAYIETDWIDVPGAVESIKAAGGIAVLAHPLKYKLTHRKLCELISTFQDAGGSAIEIVSGETQRSQIRESLNLCQQYQLYASTGSDFHGPGRSRIGLGKQLSLPPDCKPVWELWE